MKSNDVKSNSYAEYDVDSNEKGPKFIIGSHARISKYIKKKIIKLLKDILQIGQKKFLLLAKLKI